MRFSLRTLIVVMLLGGPVCAWGWREWQAYKARHRYATFDELVDGVIKSVKPQEWEKPTNLPTEHNTHEKP